MRQYASAPQRCRLTGNSRACFHVLNEEEASFWAAAARGVVFGGLCDMIANRDNDETAAQRAATYLNTWVTSAFLSSALLA
jgi:hypothetical protein